MISNWFKIFMKLNKIKYGKNLLLQGIPIAFNKKGASLEIGDNVTIKSSFLSNLIGLYQRTIIVTRTPESKIKIGNNVGISGATIYARNSIEIGDNTLIGGNCKIIDNDFHPVNTEERIKQIKNRNGLVNYEIPSKPIKIGKNCFIGCNAMILKGTILGDNCVVGAGSIVSGKFNDNCMIVGNPGKVIRYL